MNWQEKIDSLKRASASDERLLFVFDLAPHGVSEAFLRKLRDSAPFLPESYFEFLRMADGAQLDYFIIFGSGETPFPSVVKANKEWSDEIEWRGGVVVAKDAAGSVFFVRQDGKVFLMHSDPPGEPQFVAWNFDDLLENVFIGERYLSLFPRGPRQPNEWLDYLREQNWVPKSARAS